MRKKYCSQYHVFSGKNDVLLVSESQSQHKKCIEIQTGFTPHHKTFKRMFLFDFINLFQAEIPSISAIISNVFQLLCR
ncbi:hypothetical protein PagCFBP13532_23140 [Pantoea agglomerans]|nr:hypothetical protein PagCFBP13505_20540 [Pantoea agglomerans]TKK14534.1 hypothetical protein PagCFBP13516_21485 [Pantoea agglomerans]TKK25587.1 hypothetical protein PagCFBP13532_23140 [Pantoea agglomerans]